jgi:uncharacterized protein (DUF1800 family)
MLHEVSKSAAMLNFLNNQQNRKDHPNENFAREVMELFTLGRGNYTENDIKEAARAFTGWSAGLKGHLFSDACSMIMVPKLCWTKQEIMMAMKYWIFYCHKNKRQNLLQRNL